MEERFIRTLGLFFVLAVGIGFLEHLYPSIPGQSRWRRGTGLDIFYWFFTPMVIQLLSMVAIAIVLLPIYWCSGRSLLLADILHGYGPLAEWPLWVQGIVMIVLGDFIGYWTHRWHHTRQLWDYHAVHHSSEDIDWLTAVRLHPVNDIISRVCQASPALILGFSPLAVEMYAMFLSSYVALIHANVAWTYGPFRYLISSPAFHRWHHTRDDAGQGKNFAGLFPIFDVIFGTFYLPLHQQPQNFGLSGETISEDFFSQLWYPFRNWKGFQRNWGRSKA